MTKRNKKNKKANKPDLTPEEIARYKVVFALRRVGAELQSDVLFDSAIARQTGIGVASTIKLPDDLTLNRETLFAAFQKTADHEPVPEWRDSEGLKRDIRIEMDTQSAYLLYGKHKVGFPHAALLASKRERRQQALVEILKGCTLTKAERAKLDAIINKPNYGQDDFFAAQNILAGAPESFAASLREAAIKGNLSRTDLLPTKTAHWENLTARLLSSEILSEFAANELAVQRKAHFAGDLTGAFDIVSLTFGDPELVPVETLRSFGAEEVITALRHLLQFNDPFALTGAFDICAARALAEPQFVALGDELLDRILGDRTRLLGELTTFATAFVFAVAFLAEHQTLRHQPVFWRRLAAASHASLVTRVLGPGTDDEEDRSLLNWAMRISGKAYYLSVMNDFDHEPRWRPDWITQNFVAADIYGRLLVSLGKLRDDAPASWRKKLEDAHPSIVANAPPMAHLFPALLQGWRAPSADLPAANTPVGELFVEFEQNPTVKKFLEFIQLVYTFGHPPVARVPVLKAMESLRSQLMSIEPAYAQAAIDLAALIAARNRDVELAELVSSVALERLQAGQGGDHLMPTVSVLLECAAAVVDRKSALEQLARRLENLVSTVPAASLPEAVDTMRVLQSINQELAPMLGRAIALGRIGAPRGVVDQVLARRRPDLASTP
ncbi:hypothetical protein JQ616_29480 [Bradyrhizobium tropiciagri]|uniref:hypothetical protein n=1 Tax=Bradyrhizobium tropiciagri TaxID=312253 RepID=UPI001BAC443E|nr:hypothetical protein [Bradyrhizobium tropiciagri]MBR0899104.1 hypothetical protein [Bradyrhizobium tropiciagri]